MQRRAGELAAGFFIIAGIAALAFLALRVSGLSLSGTGGTYDVYAYFNDAGGLTPRAEVSLAGVTVGKVTNISLDARRMQARVTIALNEQVTDIPADSAAVIRTSGLLGAQYIDISVGGDPDSLKPGDTFYSTQSAMNLERLITNFASGKQQP